MQAVDQRAEWLAWRRRGIGGSDAPAIVGLSPFKSAIGVYLEKVEGVETDPSEAMTWGNLLEDVIADEFERRTGLVVRERQQRCEHGGWPIMRCTTDGTVCDPVVSIPALGLYEGKTTGSWDARDWDDGVPEHYLIQVQHNLAVTGLPRAWVACLVGGQQLAIHTIERDDAAIEIIEEMERCFWTEYVEKRVMPPSDGSPATAQALKAAYPTATVESRELDGSDILDLIAARKRAVDAKERSAAEQDMAESAIKILLGEAEAGTVAGKTVVTYKNVTQTRLDTDRLKQAHPDIHRQFSTTSSYRKFVVKEERK